jgi:hypothetical protein
MRRYFADLDINTMGWYLDLKVLFVVRNPPDILLAQVHNDQVSKMTLQQGIWQNLLVKRSHYFLWQPHSMDFGCHKNQAFQFNKGHTQLLSSARSCLWLFVGLHYSSAYPLPSLASIPLTCIDPKGIPY